MSSSGSIAILATNAVFLAVSAASVILRFYARTLKGAELKSDDWLVVAAWAFSAALAVTNIIGGPIGNFGMPFEFMTEDQSVAFLKFFFVIQFFYTFAVAIIKLSVLYFYRRIFSVTQTPLAIWVLIALTVGWLVSFFFATLFQIYPIWCNWVTCVPTANYPAIYVAASVTDIFLDICILSLPAFFLRSLHMSVTKKIGIAGIFGLGTFCIVASIARLVYTVGFLHANIEGNYESNFDSSVDNIIMWSGIEACISTTCANLPTYGSLIASNISRHLHSRNRNRDVNPSRSTAHGTGSRTGSAWQRWSWLRRFTSGVTSNRAGARDANNDVSTLELSKASSMRNNRRAGAWTVLFGRNPDLRTGTVATSQADFVPGEKRAEAPNDKAVTEGDEIEAAMSRTATHSGCGVSESEVEMGLALGQRHTQEGSVRW